jgi:hypothetical protein
VLFWTCPIRLKTSIISSYQQLSCLSSLSSEVNKQKHRMGMKKRGRNGWLGRHLAALGLESESQVGPTCGMMAAMSHFYVANLRYPAERSSFAGNSIH